MLRGLLRGVPVTPQAVRSALPRSLAVIDHPATDRRGRRVVREEGDHLLDPLQDLVVLGGLGALDDVGEQGYGDGNGADDSADEVHGHG